MLESTRLNCVYLYSGKQLKKARQPKNRVKECDISALISEGRHDLQRLEFAFAKLCALLRDLCGSGDRVDLVAKAAEHSQRSANELPFAFPTRISTYARLARNNKPI